LGEAGAVASPGAERQPRSLNFPLWRNRYLLVFTAVILGFLVWRAVVMFDVGPLLFSPDAPTTDLKAVSGPATWAHSRYDFGNTAASPDDAPVPGRVAWTFETSEPLTTSPAVVGDSVYLATGDGRTVCLDAETGALVWEYESGFPSNATPVVTEDAVVTVNRPGRVVALDRATGEIVWENHIKSPVTSSPVLADGALYLGSADTKLYSLDAANGEQRWSYSTGAWITASPAYADGTVAAASQNSQISVVSTRTGRRQLLYDAGGGRTIVGNPVVQGDSVYFASIDGQVWAIDRTARSWPLERTILFWKANLYIWGVISAPVQKGTVWSRNIGGKVLLPVAATPDSVYSVTTKGKVVALDSMTGSERWRTEVGDDVTAPPVVAGRTMLAGTEDGLIVGLDRFTGETLWDFETGGKVTASPVVVRGTMYVASHDGVLYAITGR
jgi:outer membrane protein assembly factor BamB